MTPEQMLMKMVAEVPSHALFAIDPSGKALSWNEGVFEVLGYREAEFIGMDADLIFTVEDRERGEPEVERRQAIEKGTVGDFRWHLRKDGTRFWANGVMHSVRDESGEVVGFCKIARDATHDKRVQEELEQAQQDLERRVEERTRELMRRDEQLRRSETRFGEVFRSAPIAIALTTPDDELLEVNEAFERITGYAADEVKGCSAKSLGMWSSPEDQEKLRHVRGETQGFRELELQIRTKDGRILDIIASAAVIDQDQAPKLVKMFLDITERKRSERHLMTALQEVMQDTSWLAHRVLEKLAQTRGESTVGAEIADLTARERDVLACIARGMNNEEIGRELNLAPSTVRNYVASLYEKLQVNSRAEAVVWARDRGMGGL